MRNHVVMDAGVQCTLAFDDESITDSSMMTSHEDNNSDDDYVSYCSSPWNQTFMKKIVMRGK